jgi:hypothetical protein
MDANLAHLLLNATDALACGFSHVVVFYCIINDALKGRRERKRDKTQRMGKICERGNGETIRELCHFVIN